MKKILFASAAAILLCSGVAQADILNAPYVSILGGWSSHPDLSIGAGQAGMENGYNAGARIGTYVEGLPGLSIDADYFYNRSDYIGSKARLGSSSFMADLTYHIPTGSPFSFYGGGGIGAVNDDFSGSLHGSSTVFGWQALGGADYALSPMTSIFAEYRYQNAHDANIGVTTGVGNTSNNLSVGVKFSL